MSLAEEAAARGVATEYLDWSGTPRRVPDDTVRVVLDAMEPYDDSPAPPMPDEEGVRCPLPPRTWGWMAQLYGARSRSSWGIGDFRDLARLAEWSAAEAGAGFVLVNPLHASAPGLPQEDSPYFPTSRRHLNPLYVAVEDVPELALADPDTRDEVLRLGNEARVLNDADLLDRDAVYRLKSRAFELLFRYARPGEPDDFAVWCAIAERHGADYRTWPGDLRHPRAPGVAEVRGERVAFHAWLQRLASEQLAEAHRAARDRGMPIGLVLDLAVGVDPGGADAWAQQDDLATGMTIGAPPDSFNRDGQDWRLPPWRPDRLRASGYAPFRDLLRRMLSCAGGLRIDHAMGLFRLWWIPDGASPAEGTYVRYPASDLLRVLVSECRRANAIAVAEDLGTVEPGVPETLRAHGILGSAVLWFEDGPPESYPELALASVTTHDLPTARGFWTDDSSPNAADRDRVRALVGAEGDPVVAMHAFVARSPSLLMGVMLGDAVGDPRRANMPGTTREQYPNWRVPLPVPLDDLTVNGVVEAVRTARSRGHAAR